MTKKKKRTFLSGLFDNKKSASKNIKKKRNKSKDKKVESKKKSKSKNNHEVKKDDNKKSKLNNIPKNNNKQTSEENFKNEIPVIKAEPMKIPRKKMKNIKVGKGKDNITGCGIKKPRNYAVIDEVDGRIAISKIQTHDQNNPKHVEKAKKGLRKPIKRFGAKSVLDKTLYIKKINGDPIKTIELDYDKANFEFNESESKSLRKFIFSSKENRDLYYEFIKGKQKKS